MALRRTLRLPRSHPLATFVALAHAVSWAVAAPLVLAARGVIASRPPAALHLAVAAGPAVAALLVTRAVAGPPGLDALLARLRPDRTGRAGWLLALSPLVFLALAAAGLALTTGLSWSRFIESDVVAGGGWVLDLVGAALAVGILEEVGWRGFALPRLQAPASASVASARLWVLWAGWHLPMFAYHSDMRAFQGWAG